jgi:hypothetical protein
MGRRFSVMIVPFLLLACAPATKDPTVGAAPAREAITPPPASMVESFKDCTWGAVTGGGLTIDGFSCPTAKLEGDESLPGIVRVDTAADGTTSRAVILQVFAKGADQPMDAVLDAVRKASPGAEECVFAEAEKGWRSEGRMISQLVPTGAAKANYDAFRAGKADATNMPCGELGPSEGGARTFEVLQEAPNKVVMISWPSDIPPFDYASLRVAK